MHKNEKRLILITSGCSRLGYCHESCRDVRLTASLRIHANGRQAAEPGVIRNAPPAYLRKSRKIVKSEEKNIKRN
jgi:hypothetical protein